MRYFRTYPWALQFLLFILMIFTMASFGRFCLQVLLPKIYGVSFATVLQQVTPSSGRQVIHAALATQGVLSICLFMLPPLLFANLTHPRPFGYLGLTTPWQPLHILLSILAIVGAMPVFVTIETLISRLNLGADVKAQQEAAETIQRAFLDMPSLADFFSTFTVMAIIPAIGEELFFRGVLMRFTRQKTRNMVVPFIFTSVIFALSHSNYYGMLSIFLAGALLASLYYLTGSLWCGIVAHLVFNGAQVIACYINPGTPAGDNSIHWGMAAGGLALFTAAFYLLWKTKKPLNPNWYKDFDDVPVTFGTGDQEPSL